MVGRPGRTRTTASWCCSAPGSTRRRPARRPVRGAPAGHQRHGPEHDHPRQQHRDPAGRAGGRSTGSRPCRTCRRRQHPEHSDQQPIRTSRAGRSGGSALSAAIRPTPPSPMLTRKTGRQVRPNRSALMRNPATTGPRMADTPSAGPNATNARGSCSQENVEVSRLKPCGISSAPNRVQDQAPARRAPPDGFDDCDGVGSIVAGRSLLILCPAGQWAFAQAPTADCARLSPGSGPSVTPSRRPARTHRMSSTGRLPSRAAMPVVRLPVGLPSARTCYSL